MNGCCEEGVVDTLVVVERVDERSQLVLLDVDHFVFALVDGAFDTVRFVVVHGVADGEAAHKIADSGSFAAQIFA